VRAPVRGCNSAATREHGEESGPSSERERGRAVEAELRCAEEAKPVLAN
jgi:hypothetical protein